ncbi:hypothetical protein [Tenacibaculum jejuense]|uniref:Uncharacterized protein n=1 Tax=Tenacibaculum jejuense TaxID=584609 RepID=A0A238U6D0_9FLAO|nr:hypothetical protein [Tenacibaculum jejuense]SNR14148.1 conserved protein of unknown function [Tenacibaculum jejuense]
MKNSIEKLKYHEKNELDEWLDLDENESKKFLQEIIEFSRENFDQIKQYCLNTIPTEFSSLSIIYEAYSEHSSDFNQFLFEEIQRVVHLAKTNKIDPECLEILTDIDTENIYTDSIDIYIQIMNFLTSNLSLRNDKYLNIQLLEVISWYIIELDEDHNISESKVWFQKIKVLAERGSWSVRKKAREILNDSDPSNVSNFFSLFRRIKRIFN